MNLRIVSYNMLKGRSFILNKDVHQRMFLELFNLKPDILVLQEFPELVLEASELFFSEKQMPYFAYGFNALTKKGPHGNAIVSRFPILASENFDISKSRFAKRGLLHTKIELEKTRNPLHLYTSHFDLFQKARDQQLKEFVEMVQRKTGGDDHLVFCGDFNDWNLKIEKQIRTEILNSPIDLHLKEKPLKTYPATLPMLPLDRIYVGQMTLKQTWVPKDKIWNKLSDHRPLVADCEI